MNAYHRPFLRLFNCLPPWPASLGGRVHSLSFGCISQDPKIVPGIQWALKSIRRMHQQILIFTFTSQVLVLHYKCHSSSTIMPFHYFFPESFIALSWTFSLFLHSIMFQLPWFQCVLLCSFMFLALKEYIGCRHLHSDGRYCCSGFLNVPSEFMFVDGSRSWFLTLGLHFDVLFVSKIPVRVVFLNLWNAIQKLLAVFWL